MTGNPRAVPPVYRALEVLGSPRMTAVIALTAIGLAFTARFVRALMGWPALSSALAVLVILALGSLFARRRELEWRGLLPVSLLIFLGWCILTISWAYHQWATGSGVAYQILFAVLGIYIALVRDLIQVIRAVGDVIRFSLVLSFALEIVSGLLIDTPIRFLGIAGNLGTASPIQGIFGTRNQLGIVALIGLITFAIELATKSVSRMASGLSISIALIGLLLTRSPVVTGAAIAVAVAALVLYALRRLQPAARRFTQFALLAAAAIGLVIAWTVRTQAIALVNAGSEFEVRYELWRQILGFVSLRPLEGWGWVGLWRLELQPYLALDTATGTRHTSALSAFVDVLLQTGLIGLFCFAILVALTFGRSWLLASNQRSVLFIWPAVVLIGLIVASLAESILLVEWGWLLLVASSVAAAHRLSWRSSYALSDDERA